jgi:hypothetical protein
MLIPTRQAMYVLRNIQSPTCNHCSSIKIIKYYIFWMCVCSLSYTSRNAHAPYCRLWPASTYNIFLINCRIFRKKIIEHKTCVSICSINFVYNIFQSKNHFCCSPGTVRQIKTKRAGGARVGPVSWGTALQAGRSQVLFSMVSLESFFDIILPAALWPWGWLSL